MSLACWPRLVVFSCALAFGCTAGRAQATAPPPAPATDPAQAAPPAATPPATTPTKPPQPSAVTPPQVLAGTNGSIPECVGLPSGEVKVAFIVTANGEATDVQVLESPSDALGACARKVVLGSKYAPATRDGKPINSKLTITLGLKENNPAPK